MVETLYGWWEHTEIDDMPENKHEYEYNDFFTLSARKYYDSLIKHSQM